MWKHLKTYLILLFKICLAKINSRIPIHWVILPKALIHMRKMETSIVIISDNLGA